MSSEKITISAEPRELESKGGISKMRKEGVVPAVIYGRKGTQNISIVLKSLPKGHTRTAVLNLQVAGASKSVIMREVQVNPLTDKPIHLDFQEVEPTDVINARIPLEYVGLTREQEKEGSFKTLLRSLDVRGPAGKLPSIITVNVGNLKVDESAHISDLDIPEGITLRAKKNLALASLVRL